MLYALTWTTPLLIPAAATGRARAARLQLLDLRQVGISAPDCAARKVPSALGRRAADRLPFQYRHGTASVLLGLRRQVVLRAALVSHGLQRQRTLSGCRHRTRDAR